MRNLNNLQKTTEISFIIAACVLVISNTSFYLYNQSTLGQILNCLQINFSQSQLFSVDFNERLTLISFSIPLEVVKHPNQHYLFAENVSNFCSKLYIYLIFGNVFILCLASLIVTIYFYVTNEVMAADMWILPIPM